MLDASVVLGSATPSVDSYYRAKRGEYRLLTLTKRVKERPLPACGVVDLRQELREGNRSILSRRLDGLMEQRLRAGEQTMLFINRRGVAGFVSCRACGHVIKCPHCDVSDVYKRQDEALTWGRIQTETRWTDGGICEGDCGYFTGKTG